MSVRGSHLPGAINSDPSLKRVFFPYSQGHPITDTIGSMADRLDEQINKFDEEFNAANKKVVERVANDLKFLKGRI